MKPHRIESDIKVFGKKVNTFPDGIRNAFDSLAEKLGDTAGLSFYGVITLQPNGNMDGYYATAEERLESEAGSYDNIKLTIPKGDYLAEEIKDWRNNLSAISTVFAKLPQDGAKIRYMIEWYQNNETMFCMIPLNDKAEILFK